MASARSRTSNPIDLAAQLRKTKVRTRRSSPFGRTKYFAEKAMHNGLVYDSKAEAAYAQWLDANVDGDVLWWNKAPTFHLGCPENVYRPDFLVVIEKSQRITIYLDDVKGRETPKFHRDCVLWSSYGPTTLRVVKLDLRYPNSGVDKLPEIRKLEYIEIRGGASAVDSK